MGLGDVAAQGGLHLGVALQALDLALHDLESLHLHRMGVLESGHVDRSGVFGHVLETPEPRGALARKERSDFGSMPELITRAEAEWPVLRHG
ncbi:hypothetical protein AEGHOMDF_1780 [Methylobacterium soli]|nr:hypothetical protein AEGHOMDF_1780 [Methylobacterium soli]